MIPSGAPAQDDTQSAAVEMYGIMDRSVALSHNAPEARRVVRQRMQVPAAAAARIVKAL